MVNVEQRDRMGSGSGFLAALDQSGGSTPKALAAYGVEADQYSGDDEMFARVHEMRTRVITSPAFNGDRVLGAILFEDTMNRQIEGRETGDYLWSVKGVVPIIKIDKGLADEADGVQVMKPMPSLDDLLASGVEKGMFGTKERSVVKTADPAGIEKIVDQQFEVGHRVLAAGLVPILEPEVDIHSPQKAEAEDLLKARIAERLDSVPDGQQIMLKLTIPTEDDLYAEFVQHPKVLRVVALSGGYERNDANERLTRNKGVIASFSRALLDGLSAQQSDAEFDATLDATIASIYEASLS